MTRRTPLHIALSIALAFAASGAHAQSLPSVGGEPALPPKAEAPLAWRDAGSAQAIQSAPRQVFGPMAAERIAELAANNEANGFKRLQVGINRDIGEAQSRLEGLQWAPVAGGHVARLAIESPDALALRAGLRVRGGDGRLEFRFSGSDDAGRVEAQLTGAEARNVADASGLFWGPITDGQVQFVEVFAPAGTDLASIQVTVPQVSHLVTSMASGFRLAPKIGESGSCNVDTKCRENTLGAAFVNAKNAVAWMNFVEGGGNYICTGTLLNDTDNATQIPYFFTANHCIDNQTVASTLVTIWNYEATSCGSGVSAATTQRGPGATLLYTDSAGPIDAPPYEGTDITLMRLNQAPPAGAYYAGWDANPVAAGASVLAIHHPRGDAKKASLGQQLLNDLTTFEAGWLSGTTEGGSSGSGLFTLGDGYQLRGGLFGGQALCANSGNLGNQGNFDIYSRLDVAWPQLQQYLAPTPQTFGPTPGRDYTGAWYNPNESGWGLTVYQFPPPTNNLFVMFFIYDQTGKAQWFEFDGTWSATDVRSGNVLQSTAGPWGPTYNPANRQFTVAGNATLTFTSATTANVSFTVNGATRNISLQKL
ncbi:serine protease [Arenimonas sp.]|uniref:trypsin-like serine peptidase n=1 Tax=Arenimonas sp. TaxID=1872635 RepID=UPI0035B42992